MSKDFLNSDIFAIMSNFDMPRMYQQLAAAGIDTKNIENAEEISTMITVISSSFSDMGYAKPSDKAFWKKAGSEMIDSIASYIHRVTTGSGHFVTVTNSLDSVVTCCDGNVIYGHKGASPLCVLLRKILVI